MNILSKEVGVFEIIHAKAKLTLQAKDIGHIFAVLDLFFEKFFISAMLKEIAIIVFKVFCQILRNNNIVVMNPIKVV